MKERGEEAKGKDKQFASNQRLWRCRKNMCGCRGQTITHPVCRRAGGSLNDEGQQKGEGVTVGILTHGTQMGGNSPFLPRGNSPRPMSVDDGRFVLRKT